jgi:hypothetical protein
VLFASSDVVANVDLQTMPMYTCLVTSFVLRQLLVLMFPLAVLGCTACITAVRSTVYRVAASHHPSIVLRAEPEPGQCRAAGGGGSGPPAHRRSFTAPARGCVDVGGVSPVAVQMWAG